MSNRISQDILRTWQCGCLDHGGVLAADVRQSRLHAETLDRIEGICERTLHRWTQMGEVPGAEAKEFLGAILMTLESDR